MTNEKINEILAACDHTMLAPDATWKDIESLCDDAMKYHTASVCVAPCFVERVKDYVGDRMTVCTVVGFPNGTQTTAVKEFEAREAICNGADEIDMVINIGDAKAGNYDKIFAEVYALRRATRGRILKVIIETCLLTDDEKIHLCDIVTEAQADYIKTSTGFSTGGATFEDVKLLRKHVGEKVKVKASGGIKTLEDAERFMDLGAERLGTSRIVKLAKSMAHGWLE